MQIYRFYYKSSVATFNLNWLQLGLTDEQNISWKTGYYRSTDFQVYYVLRRDTV
jgi:hypothetical protein